MVSTNAWTVLLVIIGAVLLLIGIVGGYMASLYAPDSFLAWMVVLFIGIIIALAGIAMGMGKSEKNE